MSNEELVEKIRNGYSVTENMQMLYEQNLPLLRKFIKPYIHYESEEDLLQECYFGLWEAVRHYESSENVLFMTYARYWIHQSVQRYLESCGSIIRRSAGFRQKIARYKKTIREFEQEQGRTPTDTEIAAHTNLKESEIQEIKIAIQGVANLDSPLKADDELTLSDTVADDFSLENVIIDKIYDEYQQNTVWAIVARYTDSKQRQVIEEHYREGKTLSQIARESGISLERVRQYKAAGLRKLRRGKAERELREKLEIVDAAAYRSGFTKFKEHGDSIVEYLAVRKAELEEKYKKIKCI